MKQRLGFIFFLLVYINADFAGCQVKSDKHDKDYHLIYLDISRSHDRQNLTYALTELLDTIQKRKDVFLLYLSNSYQPKILNSETYQKQKQDNIISLLQTLNTGAPMVRFDTDSILNYWDLNDAKTVSADDKTIILYKNIYLHYFISSDLLRLEEESLINSFLLVKDLTRKHIDPKRITVQLLFEKNDAEAFMERKSQLAKQNITGYRYIFTRY